MITQAVYGLSDGSTMPTFVILSMHV
jgi:hypothetical protein